MNRKLIIVAGILAGGKTTFSQKLSKELKIPCLNKDLIKTVLNKNIEISNREDSIKLSITTTNIMWHIIEICMQVCKPIIIEANFNNTSEKQIKELLKKYNYESLTFLFVGDSKTLHKRFIERDNSQERDNANKINGLLNDFSKWETSIKPLIDFNIGRKIIKIDTTEFSKVNFDDYIKEGFEFLYEKYDLKKTEHST